jgi:Glycosyltransferase
MLTAIHKNIVKAGRMNKEGGYNMAKNVHPVNTDTSSLTVYDIVRHFRKSESKKIRILMGVTLSEMGGAQKVVYDLLASLSSLQYELTLVTSPGGELIDWVKELNRNCENKIKIVTLPSLEREISIKNDVKTFIELFRIIKKGRFDIAHFHSSKIGILGRIAAFLAGVPRIFFTAHGWGINEYQSRLKQVLFTFAERMAGIMCSKIICVSDFDMEKCIKKKWANRNKLCVIHNGAAEMPASYGKLRKELCIPDDELIVGTVMRLKEPKDPMTFIRAAKILIKKKQNVRFIIIGDGPLKEKCIALIKDNGLENKVIMLGKRRDARELLVDFDIFVLLSKWEGLPITIIEAMLAGKPVVASDVGGVSELVSDGGNGYLLKTGNEMEAAYRIGKLLESKNLISIMGNSGYEKAGREFNLPKMIGEYEQIYALDDRKRKSRTKGPSLIYNFGWMFAGNFVYAASRGIILMLIAKLGSADMVGRFSLAFAVTTPIFMLTDFNLRSVQVTDVKGRYSFGDYLGLRLITTTISLVITLIVVLVCKWGSETSFVVLIVALAKGFEWISDVVHGLLQRKEVMGRIGKSRMAAGILSLIFMGAFFYITRSLVLGTIGLAAGWFLVLLFYDVKSAREHTDLRPRFSILDLTSLLKLSLPLGMVLAIVSFNNNIPNYFIQGGLGSESLGYFSAIMYFITAGDIVINALGQSAVPKLAKYYEEGDSEGFLKTMGSIITMGVLVIAGGILAVSCCGGWMLSLFYTPDYAAYKYVFLLVVIASGVRYLSSFLNCAVTAAQKFRIQPVLYGIVLILNIVFCAILIPPKGLEGAGYSIIISNYILMIGNLIFTIQVLRGIFKKSRNLADSTFES